MTRQEITPELAILGTSLATACQKLPAARYLIKSNKLPLTCLASIVALVMSLQARVDAALINGLVAYYDFNQSSGSSLPLVYGTGNNGVLNNMDNSDWVAGQPISGFHYHKVRLRRCDARERGVSVLLGGIRSCGHQNGQTHSRISGMSSP
jgi:hypothetical protein